MADLHFSPRQFRVSRPHFWNNAGLVRRLMLFCLPVPLAIMIALFAITHKNVEENLANAIAQNSYILSQSMGIALSQTLQETRNQIVTLATGSTSFQEFEHRIWRRLEILNSMGDARFCEAAFLGLGAQAGKRFLWIQDKGKMRSISPELTDVQPSSPFHLPLRQPEEHEVSLSIPTEVSYSFTDPDNTTSQTQLTVQLMRFTTPVTLGNGDFAGYLILSIDLDWLCEVTSRCAISMRNDLAPPPAFFVDSAGWMIFETNTKQGSAEQPAAIDSVRSGFQGDFGRAGYPQGFRPGGDYYSYWTMMNHIQKKEAGQFQTSKTPWNKEGLPVETVSYAPVLYTSGAAGRTDVVGGIVVLDTSLAATNQRSLMLRHYLIACAAAVFFLALAMFCTGIALRKTLHYLRRDIAEAGASALAKPLPERSAPKEVCEVRTEVNKLLEQLRMLEDERDMENTLTSARIEVEEAHNLPGDIPVPPDGIIGVSSEIRTLRQNILQARSRSPQLPGHEDRIPRKGVPATFETVRRAPADRRDVDRDARFGARRVPADERRAVACRERPVTLHELQRPTPRGIPRQGDRQQCRNRTHAHRRHVAQVYGKGFAAQFPGRGRRTQEVNPFGQQIRREDQHFAVRERQYGTIVADPLESVVGKCGEKPPYLVDESEFRHVF